MKPIKSIFVVCAMLFTLVTAVLVLLAIFDVTGGEETRQAVIKWAEACGVIAATALVLFWLTSQNKK